MTEFNPEISTTLQIADAYNEAKENIVNRVKMLETPAMKAEAEKEKRLAESVETLIGLDVLNPLLVEEYKSIVKEVNDKKANLEKLYGIVVDEQSIEAVSEAGQAIKDQYDFEREKINEEFNKEIEDIKFAFENDSADLRDKTDEKLKELNERLETLITESKKTDEREEAEYRYDLERSRKASKEDRENTVRAREDELIKRERIVIDEKERIEARINEIDDMKSTVDSIQTQLQNATQEGIRKANKKLGHEYECRMALITKDHENKVNILEDKCNRLVEKYNNLKEDMNLITQRLAKCNEESRVLMGETVKSIGGINILNQEQRQHMNAGGK